jgi:hypothetical protein
MWSSKAMATSARKLPCVRSASSVCAVGRMVRLHGPLPTSGHVDGSRPSAASLFRNASKLLHSRLIQAFQRFRRTAEWAKKAPRTREEWERGWAHLEPLLADIAPGTISLEDMSEVRTAIEERVSWREAHRVIKIWRALWKVAAATLLQS